MFNVLFSECFRKRKENRGAEDYSARDFNCSLWCDFGNVRGERMSRSNSRGEVTTKQLHRHSQLDRIVRSIHQILPCA
jgi:hypothetical protein